MFEEIYEYISESFDRIVYGKKAASKKSSHHYDKEDKKFCARTRYNHGTDKQNHRTKKRGLSKYQIAAMALAVNGSF